MPPKPLQGCLWEAFKLLQDLTNATRLPVFRPLPQCRPTHENMGRLPRIQWTKNGLQLIFHAAHLSTFLERSSCASFFFGAGGINIAHLATDLWLEKRDASETSTNMSLLDFIAIHRLSEATNHHRFAQRAQRAPPRASRHRPTPSLRSCSGRRRRRPSRRCLQVTVMRRGPQGIPKTRFSGFFKKKWKVFIANGTKT